MQLISSQETKEQMNEREWEKFYGGPLDKYDDRVYVTINRKGQIYMNRHTYHLIGQNVAKKTGRRKIDSCTGDDRGDDSSLLGIGYRVHVG